MNVIIVAAGASRRMGFDKLLAPLAGRPVLWHSIRSLALCPEVDFITLVTRESFLSEGRELAESAALGKPVTVVRGGAERHLSVWAGIQAVGESVSYVAVHDAARPLISPSAVAGCLALAQLHGAAICAAPVVDTIKRADACARVVESVDREGLWAMQTPQIFELSLLREAYLQVIESGVTVTDESSAVQRLGKAVALFHNTDWNFKITLPQDFALAELVCQARKDFAPEEGTP